MNYNIQLSNKTEIEIDELDYQKLIRESGTGNLIRLKMGIVNPSFIVAIIPAPEKTVRRIKGHLGSDNRTYVMDEDNNEVIELTDKFTRPIKQLQ